MNEEGKTRLEEARSKYTHLLHEVCQQMKNEAVLGITGTDVAGVFAGERLYSAALCAMSGSTRPSDTEQLAKILVMASDRKQSLQDTCRDIIQEHLALWSLIDFAMCAFEGVKHATLLQYLEAKSEAELLLVPAPDWPDVQSLKNVYRHTPKVP